ncbi:hypothetical protein B0H11DRAFT_2105559 [Mycena galericulata]|nr:hypothetical protein B0H11DRAFT_2105559 [Mycena galericulata]
MYMRHCAAPRLALPPVTLLLNAFFFFPSSPTPPLLHPPFSMFDAYAAHTHQCLSMCTLRLALPPVTLLRNASFFFPSSPPASSAPHSPRFSSPSASLALLLIALPPLPLFLLFNVPIHHPAPASASSASSTLRSPEVLFLSRRPSKTSLPIYPHLSPSPPPFSPYLSLFTLSITPPPHRTACASPSATCTARRARRSSSSSIRLTCFAGSLARSVLSPSFLLFRWRDAVRSRCGEGMGLVVGNPDCSAVTITCFDPSSAYFLNFKYSKCRYYVS